MQYILCCFFFAMISFLQSDAGQSKDNILIKASELLQDGFFDLNPVKKGALLYGGDIGFVVQVEGDLQGVRIEIKNSGRIFAAEDIKQSISKKLYKIVWKDSDYRGTVNVIVKKGKKVIKKQAIEFDGE
jgi:hypothetical protein